MAEPSIFRRKVYDWLLDWKRHWTLGGRRAVLIEGARRVGKTTLACQFGENEYDACLLIDFASIGSRVRRIFDDHLADHDIFFSKLQKETHVTLPERRSLIIFDEVQLYPKARQAIKHLVADGRYDYIDPQPLSRRHRQVRRPRGEPRL